MLRIVAWIFLLVAGALLALVRYTLGGGERLEDRTTNPVLRTSALEVVADLPLPPGYIADTSLFGRRPAIVVYDVENRTSRRLLERHPSVMPKDYLMNAAGRDMT